MSMQNNLPDEAGRQPAEMPADKIRWDSGKPQNKKRKGREKP